MAKSPGIIVAEGLGSCVALALYDVKRGLGGMAHILLPGSSEHKNRKNPAFSLYLYADSATDALLKELQYETHQHCVIAKVVGRSRMFPVYNGDSTGIGAQNILQIRYILKRKLIPLVGEDSGGDYGRSVEFHLNSGRVVVKALGKEDKEI